MSLFAHIDCLATSGAVSENYAQALKNVSKNLPTTEKDLLAIIAAALLLRPGGVSFAGPVLGDETIYSTGVDDPQSLTVPVGATRAYITVVENNIIYALDGSVPTGLNGHPLALGESIMIDGAATLADFQFDSTTADQAVIYVTYF